MFGVLITISSTDGAELTVLSPQAMKPALDDLIPQFERSTGHHVLIDYAAASALVKEIENGKAADLVILYPDQIEQLKSEGKVDEDNVIAIAKLAFGLIVRRGSPKPDIGTVHKLKQALLNTNSIAVGDPESSASGRYFANLIQRLLIADALRPKIKTFPSGVAAVRAVASGEADLGVWVISSANGSQTELVGVLPAQAKKLNSYVAGTLAESDHLVAAKALLDFLSSRGSLTLMKSKGFDPP
jgi:molybdate transport system substrate-binding protein